MNNNQLGLIPLFYSEACLQDKAEILAAKWNIDIKHELNEVDSYQYYLLLGLNSLKLYAKKKNYKPLEIDFLSGNYHHRRLYGGGKNQLIAKAFGLNKGFQPHILDTTAGLGRDAFVLASLGAKVDMLEQNNILCVMLDYAIVQALAAPDTPTIAKRMNIKLANSLEYLEKNENKVDMIYLDPMFPDKKGTALVKKDMQILQEIIGQDITAEQLLEAAIAKAHYRTIVKRPKSAPCITTIQPHLQLKNKSQRFDIYINKSFKNL